MNLKLLLIILILTIVGGFLRLINLGNNPIGLNVDEVSIGYNAYSILKTGKDEYGYKLPLTFRSLGDYKPPLYVYLTVPSIALFGLNEFAVRFPSALLGTITIPFFFIFLKYFIQNKNYALIGTILFAVSPWHLFFSRIASETAVATTLTMVGIFCLLKSLQESWKWGVVAAIFLALSMYTYHTQRLFIPLFSLIFLAINFKKVLEKKKNLAIFIFTFLLLLIPLGLSLILGSDSTRLQMTIITNDINFTRYAAVQSQRILTTLSEYIVSFWDRNVFLLFFYWIRKFLAYLQPSFLFYNGLDMTTTGSYSLGVMYLFEIPTFLIGILVLLKNQVKNKYLIFIWILLGIFPASLTLSERQPFRSMVIMPMLILISAIGFVEGFKMLQQKSSNLMKKTILIIFGLFVVWNFLQAFLIFNVHFPSERGEYFMEGNKEATDYVLNNKDKYKEIVFDPNRGTEGPFIVTVPHLYFLFYSRYDPATYQSESKRNQNNEFSFDKFTVRSINWREDASRQGVLFIGSPWSLPQKDIKEADIVKKIYLTNGNLAYFIVSPGSR
jgi:4-amino-4-deoxy-L-arabinose transferase-like glycosyltransferase